MVPAVRGQQCEGNSRAVRRGSRVCKATLLRWQHGLRLGFGDGGLAGIGLAREGVDVEAAEGAELLGGPEVES